MHRSTEGITTAAGHETCPLCGSSAPLVLLVDSDDWSTDPVDLLCMEGHSWPSANIERWMLAQVVVHARVVESGFDEMAWELERRAGPGRAEAPPAW